MISGTFLVWFDRSGNFLTPQYNNSRNFKSRKALVTHCGLGLKLPQEPG